MANEPSQTRASESDRAAPPGYGTVTPWIISRDTARLIDFIKRAFGAQELGRLARLQPDASVTPSYESETPW